MITDAPPLHAKLNKEKGLYKPFKVVIISSEVGMVKPQKEIFELALKKLKSKPNECIFVDDNEKNILVARDIGFIALHFKDNNQFVSELRHLGIKL